MERKRVNNGEERNIDLWKVKRFVGRAAAGCARVKVAVAFLSLTHCILM